MYFHFRMCILYVGNVLILDILEKCMHNFIFENAPSLPGIFSERPQLLPYRGANNEVILWLRSLSSASTMMLFYERAIRAGCVWKRRTPPRIGRFGNGDMRWKLCDDRKRRAAFITACCTRQGISNVRRPLNFWTLFTAHNRLIMSRDWIER